jgi:hypothetical protein
MATPSEKLAESLEVLHKLQNTNGAATIRGQKDGTNRDEPRGTDRLGLKTDMIAAILGFMPALGRRLSITTKSGMAIPAGLL